MAIISVCTSCGYKQPIQAGLENAKAKQAMASCLKIAPKLADDILMYLEMFSPGERSIRADKLANLFNELREVFSSAQVERNGIVYVAPLATWKLGLESVIANRSNLSLPLKTHGYLFQTVANLANSAAGKAEAKREQQRQHAPEGNRSGEPKAINKFTENATSFKEAASKLIKESGNG